MREEEEEGEEGGGRRRRRSWEEIIQPLTMVRGLFNIYIYIYMYYFAAIRLEKMITSGSIF